ncbi:hypothetical protein A9Q94_09295 [Rhodobacterales bacterium 56_14_T64]|nr:hypothetical protein A9Q94_09295 [Rhodobacterales bacterium 56_14_T64]
MNFNEAGEQISKAILSLTAVRDTLGKQLCGVDKRQPSSDPETRRLADLHDRASRVVTAYHKGC